jgi:hypothetical protein
LDTTAYRDAVLPGKTKELLGLVASAVLRRNDCIDYLLIQCVEAGQFEAILLDIEALANLPNAVSSISAILTAFLTRRWFSTPLAAIISYIIGVVIQELFYSNFLKWIFPLFLGS